MSTSAPSARDHAREALNRARGKHRPHTHSHRHRDAVSERGARGGSAGSAAGGGGAGELQLQPIDDLRRREELEAYTHSILEGAYAAQSKEADLHFSAVLEVLEKPGTQRGICCKMKWNKFGRSNFSRCTLLLIFLHAVWVLVYGGLMLSGVEACERVSVSVRVVAPPSQWGQGAAAGTISKAAPPGASASNTSTTRVSLRCPRYDEERFLAIIVMLSAPFLLLLAVDWIVHQNEYAMLSFSLVAAFLGLRSVYMTPWFNGVSTVWGDDPNTSSSIGHAHQRLVGWSRDIAIGNAIGSICLLLLYVCLATKMKSNYGAFIHRIAKTDVKLRVAYSRYSIFVTLMKLDAQFSCMLGAVAFTFFFDETFEKLFAVAGTCIAVLTWVCGYFGARQENRCLMRLFFVLGMLEPSAVAWQVLTLMIRQERYADVWKPAVCTTGISAFIIRAALVFWGCKVQSNFGQGLSANLKRVAEGRPARGGEQTRRREVTEP